jgi:predicted transglutaminase-like cysteine proteinase
MSRYLHENIGSVQDHAYIQGVITSVDSDNDLAGVTILDGKMGVGVPLYYHCYPEAEERDNGAIYGASVGFRVGDQVIVMCKGQPGDYVPVRVVGFVGGIRHCIENISGDYYIFYVDGSELKVANCNYGTDIKILDTKTYDKIFTNNFSNPLKFHLKRFSHNVGGVIRDLYFVATSMRINPNPYTGWVNFAAAHPTFPLVTNNANTHITMTPQLMADMNSVNVLVNHAHAHQPDSGSDDWQIPGVGQPMDCEDATLGKADELLKLGYPASAIHIEVGNIDSSVIGHAWLVVQTTAGDYALDINSDAIIPNSAFAAPGGEEFYGRSRQIGMRWAAISPFAWMISSLNSPNDSYPDETIFYYILDPLLNIFYEFPFARIESGAENPSCLPFVGRDQLLNDFWSGWCDSVNFSDTEIYYAYPEDITLHSSTLRVKTFNLSNNALYLIAETTHEGNGCIDHNGGFVPRPQYYNLEALSKPGYYDIAMVLSDPLTYPNDWYLHQVLGRTSGNAFLLHNGTTTLDTYYKLPNGERIYTTSSIHFCFAWTQIDTDALQIQAFSYYDPGDSGANYKMHKNGVSCLDTVKESVGVTDTAKLLGFVYIPSTDRLN